MDDYLSVNRANWDERAPAHAASVAYALERFVEDPSFVSKVVAFDRKYLGDVSGIDGVHLQCHIGTDTISLARLGARMAGLDFSPASLEQARRLAEVTGTPVRFVESDVYRALDVLPAGSFDLVYTGIGALCWLPDISRWAQVVAGLLRPGGRLFIRDGHPMLSAIDEAHTDRLTIDYPYFERHEPLVFERRRHLHPYRRHVQCDSDPRVEPRARRDGYSAARTRFADHSTGRARQRPLGGATGADDPRRAR